jgi:hypothetical protein
MVDLYTLLLQSPGFFTSWGSFPYKKEKKSFYEKFAGRQQYCWLISNFSTTKKNFLYIFIRKTSPGSEKNNFILKNLIITSNEQKSKKTYKNYKTYIYQKKKLIKKTKLKTKNPKPKKKKN